MSDNTISVRVVLAFSTHHLTSQLRVPIGTSARSIVCLAGEQGLQLKQSELDPLTVPIGVFGEQVDDDYLAQDGDRIEVYRPLQQDPKELRRRRAAQDAARKAR